MSEGWQIRISELVAPDTYVDDSVDDVLIFHPLNYSYLAYSDPFVAHEQNMSWIQAKIELMAREALLKLDKLVDDYQDMHEPQTLLFLPNVEVIENPDGTFSMSAQPVGYMRSDRFLVPYKGED